MQETQETWVRSLGQEDPLEKEMAICSSVLAWEIHGQRSLVGYRSWGCEELDTTEHTHTILRMMRIKVTRVVLLYKVGPESSRK